MTEPRTELDTPDQPTQPVAEWTASERTHDVHSCVVCGVTTPVFGYHDQYAARSQPIADTQPCRSGDGTRHRTANEQQACPHCSQPIADTTARIENTRTGRGVATGGNHPDMRADTTAARALEERLRHVLTTANRLVDVARPGTEPEERRNAAVDAIGSRIDEALSLIDRAIGAAGEGRDSDRDGGLDPEFYRDMGRIEERQRATEALARIVAAAGGEVRVPDRLLVADVTMHVDVIAGETVYRARLSPDTRQEARCVVCGLPDRGHADDHGFSPDTRQEDGT